MGIDKQCLITTLKNKNLGLNDKQLEDYAQKLIGNLDERLIPNLKEWIDGKKISDIWIGKYCVNAIMSIRGDSDFLGALEAMNTYLCNEADGIHLIWRGKQ